MTAYQFHRDIKYNICAFCRVALVSCSNLLSSTTLLLDSWDCDKSLPALIHHESEKQELALEWAKYCADLSALVIRNDRTRD